MECVGKIFDEKHCDALKIKCIEDTCSSKRKAYSFLQDLGHKNSAHVLEMFQERIVVSIVDKGADNKSMVQRRSYFMTGPS